MGIIEEIKKTLKVVHDQVTQPGTGAATSEDFFFTPNFRLRASQWNLSEKDALDVYYHGKERKPNMRVRTYNGYEIGIYHGHTKTGKVSISSIWKWKRR